MILPLFAVVVRYVIFALLSKATLEWQLLEKFISRQAWDLKGHVTVVDHDETFVHFVEQVQVFEDQVAHLAANADDVDDYLTETSQENECNGDLE